MGANPSEQIPCFAIVPFHLGLGCLLQFQLFASEALGIICKVLFSHRNQISPGTALIDTEVPHDGKEILAGHRDHIALGVRLDKGLISQCSFFGPTQRIVRFADLVECLRLPLLRYLVICAGRKGVFCSFDGQRRLATLAVACRTSYIQLSFEISHLHVDQAADATRKPIDGLPRARWIRLPGIGVIVAIDQIIQQRQPTKAISSSNSRDRFLDIEHRYKRCDFGILRRSPVREIGIDLLEQILEQLQRIGSSRGTVISGKRTCQRLDSQTTNEMNHFIGIGRVPTRFDVDK